MCNKNTATTVYMDLYATKGKTFIVPLYVFLASGHFEAKNSKWKNGSNY